VARYVEIDGCPVPVAKADIVRACKAKSGGVLQSCYRGDDPEGVAILNRNRKHSQRQIVNATPAQRAAWGVLGTPNPVHQSTHEGYSDAVAYPGPKGRRLKDWQIGEDWRNADIERVIRAYSELGVAPIHPYAAGVEYHHINWTKPPRLPLALKRGDRGPRVWLLTHRMAVAGLVPHSGLFFNAHVEQRVRAFQRRIHVTPDGIVGLVTWRNVQVAARHARHVRKAARR
jgi:hypothetical protein